MLLNQITPKNKKSALTDFFYFYTQPFKTISILTNIKTTYTMKKIIPLIAIGFLFISCDMGSENSSYFELAPVNTVDMPTAFAKDSITKIPVKYIRRTGCHFFYDFFYDRYDFTRTVAIYTVIANSEGCTTDNVTLVEVPLKFKPTELGTYHFRFWTGDNAQGVSQYIEYDAIVDH